MLTVVFFGKTGAGKSSTLNALFGLALATDPAVACTSKPQVTLLDPDEDSGLPDEPVRVVDMPGIAESLRAEDLYQPYYEKWVPQADSLVWVTQADTRAYKRDQLYLMKLLPLLRPGLQLIVALNRVDDLGVDEGDESFNTALRRPSAAQLAVLPEKISDVYGVFKEILGEAVLFDRSHIVPYTARYGWGLEKLKIAILKGVER
jgi:predicted GTPase